MAKKRSDTQLTIRLTADLKAALKEQGDREGKTVTDVALAAICSYLGLPEPESDKLTPRFADAAHVDELAEALASLQATVKSQGEQLTALTESAGVKPPAKKSEPSPRLSKQKVRVGATRKAQEG